MISSTSASFWILLWPLTSYMTSPGHKNVSHMAVFGFTNPPIFWLMYSTYLCVNRLRNERTLSCRGGFVKTKKPIRATWAAWYAHFVKAVKAVKPRLQCISRTIRFHRLIIYKKILNDIKINTIRQKGICTFLLSNFLPQIAYKIDLEITVSKRDGF